MRYDFNKMDSDSFELVIRSLNEKMFGIKCDQYGLGPDQRELTFVGNLVDSAGTVFNGRTIGQVKYKYLTTKTDDYTWLTQQISGELKRFREQDKEYLPDNYLSGLKDKIDEYVKTNNDIIEHFYVKGYDEICALLDNNHDVATAYAEHVLSGDVLMPFLDENSADSDWLEKYLYREFEEDMYTRMEQAGSATEKRISIEKVCVDINVLDREYQKNEVCEAYI